MPDSSERCSYVFLFVYLYNFRIKSLKLVIQRRCRRLLKIFRQLFVSKVSLEYSHCHFITPFCSVKILSKSSVFKVANLPFAATPAIFSCRWLFCILIPDFDRVLISARQLFIFLGICEVNIKNLSK